MTEQIQTIGAEYNALINQGATLRERIALMIVDSNESELAATEVLAEVVRTRKSLENDKEKIYRPIKTALDEVTSRYKGPLAQFETIEKGLKDKIGAYRAEQIRIAHEKAEAERKEREAALAKEMEEKERVRKEQEERIRAQAQAQADAARAAGNDAKAEEIKTQAENVIGLVAAEQEAQILNQIDTAGQLNVRVEKTIVTSSGASAGTRMVWDYEVLNARMVPDAFVKVEIRRADVLRYLEQHNGEPIVGLRVFQKPMVSVRA